MPIENQGCLLLSSVSYLNGVSGLGLLTMVLIAWFMSSQRRRFPWRIVIMGIALQITLGFLFFNSQTWTFDGRFQNGILFYAFDTFFNQIKGWADEGAKFVFTAHGSSADFPQDNPLFLLKTFAVGVLPTVIFFSSLMSVLYHVGIMEKVVKLMAWFMRILLGTSGSESLAAAANVFIGHTEAPLVVRPYIATMTRSELNAMMVGGFATITGGLMAVYVGFGVSAGHLVTASIISAPAALVIAKVLQPETEKSSTLGSVSISFERQATNVIEAAANGASDGIKLALNITAMLIAFLALVAMVDAMLSGSGQLTTWFMYGDQSDIAIPRQVHLNWSLAGMFGYLFYPLAWLLGIESKDCLDAGQLLGTKMVVNEFLAYAQMGEMIENARSARETFSPRSKVILTYGLCGFSNFGAIGIQLGGIGPLAPERKSDLAQLGLRAMVGGMLACCMTACVAGMLYGLFG